MRRDSKKVYAYNLDGTLYMEFDSLNAIIPVMGKFEVAGAINKLTKEGNHPLRKGKYWSYTKYKNILTKEKAEVQIKIPSIIECPVCKSRRFRRQGTKSTKFCEVQCVKCIDCGKKYSYDNNPLVRAKRVVIIGDMHCGHATGLTPHEFNIVDDKYFEFRKNSWDWYRQTIQRLKPIDVLIVNGDAIDGRGEKSGGSEIVIGDRFQQCKCATRCINEAEAERVYLTVGTPYHVGNTENWEKSIADGVGGEIYNILKLDINGCRINAKHKTGRSRVPHGRFTQLALTSVWEDLKISGTELPKVNVIIRSHVHYAVYMGHGNNREAFTTPALQGQSDYGEKECEGIVDYGITLLDIDRNGCFKREFIIENNLDKKKEHYKNIYE